METIKVAPSELRTGDVLCGDDGKPFAFVRNPVTQPDGTVMVDALDFPYGNPFTEVEFLSGTDATILKARITDANAGTWLSGPMGWHNGYRVILRAMSYGFVLPTEYDTDWDAFTDTLAHDDGPDRDMWDDIHGDDGAIVDKATEFLDLRAPAGFEFHWDAGELSLAESWAICAMDGNGCTEDERCEDHREEEN